MSRNIRQKYPATAAKAQKRRRGSDTSSSLDLSDEEGYSAVEDISDSEDNDEEDVTAVEEAIIVTEGRSPSSHAPRPQPDEEEEEEEEDGDEDDAEEEAEDEDDDADDLPDDGDADDASWAGILSDVDDGNASDFYHDSNAFASDPIIERHVRFDVPDSDSDSTETEDDHADLFPDIFVSQNSLDPSFRKELEHDPDESSGSNSFWDYHGQYEEGGEEEEDSESDAEEVVRQLSDDETSPTAMPTPSAASVVENFTPTFEESLELDGYESDGDTTDEEDIPEPVIRKRTRRQSNTMSDEASDSEADSPVKPERGQPRVGRFNLDRSDKKPIAVLNPLTRKMMIFTPHRRRQLDLSPEQFNFPWAIEDQSSPLLSNSANMMLSAMFSSNTFGDFINAQAMGPAEAFFPFQSTANGDDSSTSPSMEDEDEDEDDEEKLNINDFITFGEADDDESSGDEGNDDNWGASPKRPTTASGEILSHLNSDTVGAFRRNQINQQLILSNQATQDSLAFSGPYNYTALRGLKSDRFDTAAVPLTPIRRHKKQLSDRAPPESTSTKRKATGEANGSNHKRHRSISSDVNFLRI